MLGHLLDAGDARGAAHDFDAMYVRLGEVGLGQHLVRVRVGVRVRVSVRVRVRNRVRVRVSSR